ncbi:hypothetical protein [Ornithinibacillus halotolerans]|uniref:Lipoprotein n=1 Tax=Ornithinibacillus halotolerans TaxID=1274357 RepID=A0A916RR18_9BACI|nr:hypothetical protein [Ornithinibacillus halotolerans]GGA65561.1 hypothetical protein GCM10008025_06720 [Ornithinibacillus halotolerans]
MKKLMLVLTGIAVIFLLGACSSPESDEVLEYHNDLVDYINPKLDEIPELYNKMAVAETDEEAMDIFENELQPLVADMKDYLDSQSLEHDVAKKYHNLNVELVNAMSDVLAKEKEFLDALLDPEVSEEVLVTLETELTELDNIVIEKEQEVSDHWDSLVEEYDFEEIEE